MRFILRSTIAAALVLGTAVPATAQVVNGGAPNGGAGWNIFDDNRAATAFSVSGPITFDAVRFWGILFENAPYTPDIFWQILSDDAGSPGASVVSQGSATATSTLRTALDAGYSWRFDFSTGTQTLASGIYWLALHDGPLDPGGFNGSSLIWETSDRRGTYAVQTFSIDQRWSPGGDTGLAFELRSNEVVVATPEPATLALLATGLASMGSIGFRSRRRNR